MFLDWSQIEIYIQPGHTDMRKHINSLSAIVQGPMNQDAFSGSLYIFCSRNRKRLKVIYWDRNGFCLWFKRLEKDKFPWPENVGAAEKIKTDQLKMLLTGIDFFHMHQSIKYKKVF